MFSATFPEDVQKLACDYLKDYVFLSVGIVGGACKDVEQIFIQAEMREKKAKLLEVLKQESKYFVLAMYPLSAPLLMYLVTRR